LFVLNEYHNSVQIDSIQFSSLRLMRQQSSQKSTTQEEQKREGQCHEITNGKYKHTENNTTI
jgi:hypothetical protein